MCNEHNFLISPYCNTKYVLAHYRFIDEFSSICDYSGNSSFILKKLNRGIKFLESLKRKCILIKEFEQLKNEDNLYSFRISTKNNIRIIFVFLKIIGSEKAVFLNAFQEKTQKIIN